MGSRSLGELLLRPSSLLSLTITQTSAPVWRRAGSPCLCQRTFTCYSPSRAAQPQSAPYSESELSSPQPNRKPSSQATDNVSPTARKTRATQSQTSDAIDDIFRSFGSNNANLRPRQSSSVGGPTSADELSNARRQFGAKFSPRSSNFKRQPLNWEDMAFPTPPSGNTPAAAQASTPAVKEEDIVYPRLNASTGRTVTLDPAKGRDIVRGIAMLGSLMSRNKVRADFMKQRFHERNGLKRKRLKSERWRARFKIGFDATCKRVSELTRKGW